MSNMNLQFITGVYAVITYVASYLCKPKYTMREHIEKASKEAYGKEIKGKMLSIGIIFLTKLEVSTYEAIKKYYLYIWGIQIKVPCIFLPI